MLVESKQLWKNKESRSDVCMCGVSTQQWPSTQIALLKRTPRSERLDAVATSVDKEWVNSCALKDLLFEEDQQSKKSPKPPGNVVSNALLLMCVFLCFIKPIVGNRYGSKISSRGFVKPCFAGLIPLLNNELMMKSGDVYPGNRTWGSVVTDQWVVSGPRRLYRISGIPWYNK